MKVLRVTAYLLIAAGVGLGVAVVNGNRRYYDPPEAIVVFLAWAALFGAPGMLVLLGLRGRPALLLPAGVILIPLSMLSFAGVLLPLLVPAVLCIVGYERARADGARPVIPAGLTMVFVVVLLIAAVAALFVHPDAREYATPTESGGTSDVLTGVEGLVILALVGTALAVGWMLAAPRQELAAASRQ